MARQKLINLHSSGTTVTSLYTGDNELVLGEIAVQHAQSAPKLHIRVSNGEGAMVAETLASFVDESAVDLKISTAVGTVSQNVDAINAKIGTGFDSTHTVAKAIQDEAAARASGDTELEVDISVLTENLSAEVTAREATDALLSNEITARTSADTALDDKIDGVSNEVDAIQLQLEGIPAGSGAVATYIENQSEELTDALDEITAGTSHDYVTVTISDKTDRIQTVEVAVAAKEVSAATASKQGFADAYDVKQITDSLDGRLDTAESNIGTLQDQLKGFGTNSGSVKTYVDGAISSAISSVYKVKGSVASYDLLPASGQVIGDVYNVIAAYSTYPAGTNFVWNGTEWDALGGTIDLSPYLYISAFTAYTAATETRLGGIEGDIDTLESSLTAETKSRQDADTEINGKIGSGFTSSSTIADAITNERTARTSADTTLDNKITAETQARQNAVSALTSSAETNAQNITNEANRAQSAETSLNNAVTAETKARQDADTALSGRIDNLSTASTALNDAITAETQARQNADSALTSSAETNAQNITAINEKLGNGFTTASTVASQLAAVKSTADSAVQSVSVKNTSTNKITATEDGTTHNVELDFDNMVIDCGTY